MRSASRAERGRWPRGAALTLATIVLASVTAYPLCDLVFDCGCTWPLLGADAHCDIHTAGPPDCPVCTHPPIAAAASVVLLAAWGAVVWGSAAMVTRLRTPTDPGA